MLWHHAGSAVSVNDVINVMQASFEVSIITFVSTFVLVRAKQNNSDKMYVSSFLSCM